MDKKVNIGVTLLFVAIFSVVIVLLVSCIKDRQELAKESRNNEKKITQEVKWDESKDLWV